jgi:tripartite-type tricarboxylate transporter receptor subunit TctC
MKIRRRQFLHLAAGAAALPTVSRIAWAQAYPTRSIKLVVPVPAGGPTDTLGRIVGQRLSSILGQPVIIENQSGAGTTIGMRAVARAKPDGYTLIISTPAALCTSTVLYKLDYDPLSVFTPVGTFALDPAVLVVSPSVPAKTVQELIQYAKANPGKLSSGSATGTTPALLTELFKSKTGVNIPNVPYRGAAPAITDLLGGQIQLLINNKSVLAPYLQEGKLKALAVASATRWQELPDVPTMLESGLEDFPSGSLYGIFAPKGTPSTIIDRLNAAINEGMNFSETRQTIAKIGAEAKVGTPQQFATLISHECPNWTEIARLTGIKPE